MQDYKITCPEDWYEIQKTVLGSWKKHHGMFVKDIQRLEKTVEGYISEAGKKLVLYRQTHARSYLEAAHAEYQKASDCIRAFSKREILATLSQR